MQDKVISQKNDINITCQTIVEKSTGTRRKQS